MHVLKEKEMWKKHLWICKEMWKKHLWITIIHVSSFILLKTQYFFKNNYKIGLLKQNPR